MTNLPKRRTKREQRTPDFLLTTDDLRAVTAFALMSAECVLPAFEARCPDDTRPRTALDAARTFVDGAPRSRAQRVAAPAAHRAARDATSPMPFHAAMAAGDAAASAYLHPLADAAQVGHILRASAHALRVVELGTEAECALGSIEGMAQLATPQLVDVLLRYPKVNSGQDRISQLLHALDTHLRAQPRHGVEQR